MPSNVEVKIDTGTPPTLAQAKMLLTWIGEYYPGLVVPEEGPEPTPQERVDNGEVPSAQLSIDYDDTTGEIIAARCGGCDGPIGSLGNPCPNPDCPYNADVGDDADGVGEDGSAHSTQN